MDFIANNFFDNLDNLGIFEILNLLNCFLLYHYENMNLIRKLLDIIEKKILEISKEKELYNNYLTLIQIIHLNILYEYPECTLGEYKNFLEFSKNIIEKNSLRRNFSNFQNNIKKILLALNIEFEEEKLIGPFLVDFFIAPNICLEINGKSHYVNNKKLTASTDRKYRLLKKMNFDVKIVPSEGWHKFERSWSKIAYIKNIIF